MKKKLFLIISMCLCLVSFTACGKTDPTTVDYNGYTYDQLESTCQGAVQTLEALTDEDAQNYLENGSEDTVALIQSWEDSRTDLGAFVGFGDFEVTKSGKTLTAAQTVNYESRPLILTYVYNYNSMDVEGITVDLVYTTGEKMEKAGMNTIMGVSIVFVVLILMSLVIYAFRIIPYVQDKFKNRGKVEEAPAKAVVEQISQREAQQEDDLELISVIAAAIAAATGSTTDDFVVRSIKRRK